MKIRQEFQVFTSSQKPIAVKIFEPTPYDEAYQAMFEYTNARHAESENQIWLVEHPAVYTQGTACQQNTLFPSHIPIVKTDRGGQITYHGPGQMVMYPLLHLRTFRLGVKALVNALEQSVIDSLKHYRVVAVRHDDAPGVYVDGAKIAALGLRIRRGNSYHGLSFNIDMDLSPFSNIDPCGYQGLQVTQLKNVIAKQESIAAKLDIHFDSVARLVVQKFVSCL